MLIVKRKLRSIGRDNEESINHPQSRYLEITTVSFVETFQIYFCAYSHTPLTQKGSY